jgi:hypothetical protein
MRPSMTIQGKHFKIHQWISSKTDVQDLIYTMELQQDCKTFKVKMGTLTYSLLGT